MLADRLLILEVFETRQVELATKIEPVCRRVPRILAKLIQGFNCTGGVLAAQVWWKPRRLASLWNILSLSSMAFWLRVTTLLVLIRRLWGKSVLRLAWFSAAHLLSGTLCLTGWVHLLIVLEIFLFLVRILHSWGFSRWQCLLICLHFCI